MTATPGEKADACDRYMELEDSILGSLADLDHLLLEGTQPGSRLSPLFGLERDLITDHLSQVRRSLDEAHRIVAILGYDQRRLAQAPDGARVFTRSATAADG